MPYNEEGFLQHENPIVDFELGSRNDGKLKVNLVFPPDYDYCPFRHYVYDTCVNDIKSYLHDNNINYFQSWEDANRKNHFRKSLTITPKIDDKELTKVFDTKEAVADAIKNNNLVIVAGDGSNDFEMLNPLEYISKQEWEQYAANTSCPEFFYGDMRKKLRDLRHLYKGYDTEYINDLRNELTENGFLEKLEEMPLVGIVVKKGNSNLQKLVDTFSRSGKIIEVENGQLDEGIKRAIINYMNINNNFKIDMTENLRKIVESN